MLAEAKRLGIAKDDQWLEEGDMAEGLTTLIQKIHADLLLIGSHKHRLLGYLFGSTSNSILHLMPCDVLAIRINV